MNNDFKTQIVLKQIPLTPESLRMLWAQTYNTRGKPDWSHLFPYYHDEINFEDSIQRIEGKVQFMEMYNRLFIFFMLSRA